MNCNSRAIVNEAEKRNERPTFIAAVEGLILWRFLSDGTEVIETNGDPVWDTDDGFENLRSTTFIIGQTY